MYKYAHLLLGSLLVLLPAVVVAQIDPCPLGVLSCPGNNADAYFSGILINGAKTAFAGVLIAVLVWYGFKLIMGADNDSTVSEVYNAYAFAAIGTILAGGAFMFANTFGVGGILINTAPTNSVLAGVIAGFKALLYTLIVFNIFYQGYRLVSSQDDSQVEKAKKQFIYGLVGGAIVLLADVIVPAFVIVDPSIITTEAIGIANFIGTILGAFALIALFIAGIWLVLAVNEQNKDKAKKVIFTAFIVLLVCMISLVLIRETTQAPL